MALIVQKFGGSSVADLGRIDAVAEKIAAARQAGHELVVVVSAMAGETDRLLGLARALCDRHRPNPRELDVLLATGEQVTIALLAMALEKRQISARSWTGGQAGIRTDAAHTKARIRVLDVVGLRADLAAGRVPVVAGFQGVTDQGAITTLGRGGSDTTAVALAAALGAAECQIYTDVDGVYTTDPRVVPEARRLPRIGFEAMLEMAGLGSKVLQIRAVEFAGRYRVPLRVLSTFEAGPGTLIDYEEPKVEQAVIAGIAFNRDEAVFNVRGLSAEPAALAGLLGLFASAQIELDMLVQQPGTRGLDLGFTVHRNDYAQTLELLRQQGLEAEGDNRVAKISLVGVGVRSHAGIAARLFEALAAEGIAPRLVSTSEVRISVLVAEDKLELGVRAVHRAFELDREDSVWQRSEKTGTAGRRRAG